MSKKIVEARKTMALAMKDEGMKLGYVANVAMLMYDKLHEMGYKPKLRPDDRNEIAEAILDLVFGTESE